MNSAATPPCSSSLERSQRILGSGGSSPLLVGAYHAFVNSDIEECENCRDQAEAEPETKGFVHLNVGIQTYSSSLDPKVVKPYLADKLIWRVQKVCQNPSNQNII